jgi:hypothetical protein
MKVTENHLSERHHSQLICLADRHWHDPMNDWTNYVHRQLNRRRSSTSAGSIST